MSRPFLDPSMTPAIKLPKWNYDGFSTGQAPGQDSEVILYPQAIFRDLFKRGNNILVRGTTIKYILLVMQGNHLLEFLNQQQENNLDMERSRKTYDI
ncbi:hypothetical protein Taro_033034 [Colocasia esculenta]|uniref:Uncharacterized protein n=1 Tax=Colocasia esculenta TaxID=4460 RepID=A0A843VSU9_COLES|nr:hypothetical protein [Colocasia esculenta]